VAGSHHGGAAPDSRLIRKRCAGPPILVRAMSWPKHVVLIDVMVLFSGSIGKTWRPNVWRKTTTNPSSEARTNPVRPAVFPVISLSRTQRSIRELRVEAVRQKSTKVQRRAELPNQTLPAIFVGAIALDVKKH